MSLLIYTEETERSVPNTCPERQYQVRAQAGFTGLELIVALAITLVLISLAVPQILQLVDVQDRHNAHEQLQSDLRWARAEAIAKGARVIPQFTAGSNVYSLGIDYVPFSNNLTPDGTILSRVLPDDVSVTVVTEFAFDPRGATIDENGFALTGLLSLEQQSVAVGSVTAMPTGNITYEIN